LRKREEKKDDEERNFHLFFSLYSSCSSLLSAEGEFEENFHEEAA
jgi:hypothetical protein